VSHRWSLSSCRILLAAVGAGLVGASTAPAQQQAQAAPEQQSCGRCLSGFRFLPSSIVGDPFATTYFQNSTGGGMALDLDVPVHDLDGNVTGSLTGNIGFLLVSFDYQKSIAPWLALNASVNGIGRIGTSVESVVATGVSAAFGGTFGATVPLVRRESFLVSAMGEIRRNSAYEVDPYSFVRGVADSGYTDETKSLLLESNKGNRYLLGLRGAWGLAPWVGLSAQFDVGQVDLPVEGMESVTGFALQAGFDFAKRSRIPVASSLAFRGLTGPGKSGDATVGGYQVTELGIFYSGRTAFTIGGEFLWSKLGIRAEDVPDIKAVQFRIVTKLDF
jgi:hypothetical protein